MNVAFRPMLAGDVVQLRLQPSQHFELGLHEPVIDLEKGRDLAENGRAWTAWAGSRILAIAGFRETFPGVQAVAWAMIGELGTAHLAVTRFARARIAEAPYRRLEAIVDAGNARAVAWARLVGLERNAVLRCFGQASETHLLFERIRDHV